MVELLEAKNEFEDAFRNTPNTKSNLEKVNELDTESLFDKIRQEIEKRFTVNEMTTECIISVRNDKRKNIQNTITSIENVIEDVLVEEVGNSEDIRGIMSTLFNVDSMSSGGAIYISVRRL